MVPKSILYASMTVTRALYKDMISKGIKHKSCLQVSHIV